MSLVYMGARISIESLEGDTNIDTTCDRDIYLFRFQRQEFV